MNEPENRVIAIYAEAIEIVDPNTREEYLSKACGADQVLRNELDALLEAEAQSGQFLPEKPSEPVQDPFELTGPGHPLPLRSEQIGGRIGRYKLLQKIGEGGCGIVYMAEQEEPVRRKVAFKIVKLGMDTRSVVARFEAERQALALMDHPNIAKVLDAGSTDSGRPYFVMELVRGQKITTYCDQQKLAMRQRLDLFIQVCHAVQHAHQKGIIHRDLKPSNILVTERDGVPVPKVIDFGIAKATGDVRLTDKTLFTGFEQFIGTPAYMSPEQARRGELDIDTRSDIYSLGVLLYELLTGKTPFDTQALLAAGLDEMRRTIQEKEPAKPSTRLTCLDAVELASAAGNRQVEGVKLVQLLRRDLDWIIMKCLDKDWARRYETANSLARDIERHLKDEPVLARPPNRLYTFRKIVCRHKVGFAATAMVIMTLAAGVVVSTLEALSANRSRAVAQRAQENSSRLESLSRREAENARRAERDANEKLRESYITQAQAGRWSGRPGRRFEGLDLLSKAAKLRPGLDLRNEAIACMALADVRSLRKWTPRDGEYITTFNSTYERYAYHDAFGTIHVCRVEDAAEIMQFPGYEHEFRDMLLSPDGNFLLVSCAQLGYRIELLDLKRQNTAFGLPRHDFRTADFSSDSRLVAIAYDWTNHTTSPVKVFEVASHREIGSFSCDGLAFSIRFNPHDSSRLLVSDQSELIRLWDWQAGRVVQVFQHPSQVQRAEWHPDGQQFASGCYDNSIRIWDANAGKELFKLNGHEKLPAKVTFSFDGRFLASEGWEGMMRLWDLEARRELLRKPVAGWLARFSTMDNRLAESIGGGQIELLEASAGQGYRALRPDAEESASCCAFCGDGQLIISTGETSVHLWDASSGKLLWRAQRPTWHGFVVPNSDSTNFFIAAASGLERLVLEKATAGEYALKSSGAIPLVSQFGRLQLTRDSRTLVSGSVNSGAHLLDISSGLEVGRLDPGYPEVFAAITADGRLAATYGQRGSHVQIWDVATSNIVHQIPLSYPNSIFADFSRDGQLFALGNGIEFRVYEIKTWKQLYTLTRQNAEHWAHLAFSPDSQLLAVAISRTTILLVEALTGRELARLEAPELHNINWITFDGKGDRLAAACGIIQLWDLRAIRQQLSLMNLDWETGVASGDSERQVGR
jgi:serine/threonine protein kinase/WD40 repeat protein